MRHASFAGGLRASVGSWYFSTIVWPAVCTVFEAAARRPLGAQFGFSFSMTGPGESVGPSFSKAAFCGGNGARERWSAFGD